MQPSVIGLDLSLASSGIVIVNRNGEVLEAVTLPGKGVKGHERLSVLGADLKKLLVHYRPELGIVEDLPRGAHGASQVGMAHGIARSLLFETGTPFHLVVPSTLKKCATGDGRAAKPAMKAALPEEVKASLSNSDEIDAYWLAQVGLFFLGEESTLTVTSNLKGLVLQE